MSLPTGTRFRGHLVAADSSRPPHRPRLPRNSRSIRSPCRARSTASAPTPCSGSATITRNGTRSQSAEEPESAPAIGAIAGGGTGHSPLELPSAGARNCRTYATGKREVPCQPRLPCFSPSRPVSGAASGVRKVHPEKNLVVDVSGPRFWCCADTSTAKRVFDLVLDSFDSSDHPRRRRRFLPLPVHVRCSRLAKHPSVPRAQVDRPRHPGRRDPAAVRIAVVHARSPRRRPHSADPLQCGRRTGRHAISKWSVSSATSVAAKVARSNRLASNDALNSVRPQDGAKTGPLDGRLHGPSIGNAPPQSKSNVSGSVISGLTSPSFASRNCRRPGTRGGSLQTPPSPSKRREFVQTSG